MDSIWAEVTIDNKKLPIAQLTNNGNVCIGSDMNIQSCTLTRYQNCTKIPITVRKYKGKNVESLTLLYQETLELVREKSLASFISRLLDGNGTFNVKIDVFYNKAENNNICIGFVSQSFQANRCFVRLDNSCRQSDEQTQEISHGQSLDSIINGTQKEDILSAKDCLINNVDKFSELIPLTTINKDKKIVSEWESTIKTIPDSNALYYDFQKYKSNLEGWLIHLKSWGLKQDSCKEYPGCLIDKQRYYTTDDTFDVNKQYTVLSPCWTLWKNIDGKSEEIVVSIGLIKEK